MKNRIKETTSKSYTPKIGEKHGSLSDQGYQITLLNITADANAAPIYHVEIVYEVAVGHPVKETADLNEDTYSVYGGAEYTDQCFRHRSNRQVKPAYSMDACTYQGIEYGQNDTDQFALEDDGSFDQIMKLPPDVSSEWLQKAGLTLEDIVDNRVVSEMFKEITKLQQLRVLKYVAGMKKKEIAASEGLTAQTISDSFKGMKKICMPILERSTYRIMKKKKSKPKDKM